MFRESVMPIKKILISGAGIAGLALARQLGRLNIPFKLIEKRTSLSTDGAGIALPANAMKALRYVGLGSDVDQRAHQVNKIIYTDSTGIILSEASLLEAPLNADRFVALHRRQFHDILREGVESAIHFGTTIKQMTQAKNGVLVQFDNAELPQEEFSAVIGADGINSHVRQLAFNDTPLTDLGVTIWRWTCKHATDDLQPTYMLGARDLLMAYPIGKNEVYCYAHVFDPENALSKSVDHRDALTKQFGQHGGIAKTMLQLLPDNQFIIPGRLRSVPKPLYTSGRVVLIGDAGHGCSPMLQQGAACALEDVIALSELLKHFSVEEALSHYEKFRSERVNWITASSDGPMKMLINVDSQMLLAIQQKIRENGPLNVQGWKKLLATDPLNEISMYINQNKIHKGQMSDQKWNAPK
jgi:2-polyprenyl-6-methoxyphenol hydroxylase-like FAD-dependent oxidoreductase